MNGRLLILGGTGFIGRRLSENAIRRGLEVVVISINPPKESESVEGVNYLSADISNLILLKELLTFRSFDYVINLSGYVNHTSYLSGGKQVIDTHFIGVQNLLYLLEWKSIKRFVQIGSSDEYGNNTAPQNEAMQEDPSSSYSFGKMASTHLIKMLAKTENFPGVILRLFLVYGPYQNNERFLPQIINGCLSNSVFPVSSGQQLRDFCYIDDVVDGIF
jgi:nucleoside-diphosphate-sugar epimerase